MPMNEEITQALVGTEKVLEVQVRQVAGGFIVAGVTRYNEPDTGQTRAHSTREAITSNAKDVGELVTTYLQTETFK